MDYKFCASKSFILSVLIHAIIFYSIVFVFPVHPEPLKPKLVFLGPILKKQLLPNISSQNNYNQKKHFVYENAKTSEHHFASLYIEKPKTEDMEKQKKTKLKSLFPLKNTNDEPVLKEKSTTRFDADITPYNTLKLK